MATETVKKDTGVSHFRLLLWLKFRLIRGAFRRDKSTLVGSIIAVLVLLPLSLFGAYLIFTYASANPLLAPPLLRCVLAIAYVVWFITPVLGFSLNESYDPTRLFVYPVRYQTIFLANVVGSLFEMSTFLLLPILVALLAATFTSLVSLAFGIVLLLIFLLQTIALGQAVTLTIIGFLKSRRFRDAMIVIFPLIAILRYVFTPRYVQGQGGDIDTFINSPAWRIADFLPPGWTALAMVSIQSGHWAVALLPVIGLIAASAVTVYAAVTVLGQLYSGDRGVSLSSAKTKIAEVRPEVAPVKAERDIAGDLGPILALAQKEWRYLIRDPQYKALAMRILYMVVVFGISFTRGTGQTNVFANADGNSVIANYLRFGLPMLVTGLLILATLTLTFNIFGGEGPAITMLLSFPVQRRYLVIGKNLAFGSIVLGLGVIGNIAAAFLLKDLSFLPLALCWLTMATFVILGAGNLVSVWFPTRLIVRGSLFSRGGQISIGTARSPGAGCAYSLLYLAFTFAAFVAEGPAAAAVILPNLGLISPIWNWVTLPFGFLYAFGIYAVSLLFIDGWMATREQNIIRKLAPAD